MGDGDGDGGDDGNTKSRRSPTDNDNTGDKIERIAIQNVDDIFEAKEPQELILERKTKEIWGIVPNLILLDHIYRSTYRLLAWRKGIVEGARIRLTT